MLANLSRDVVFAARTLRRVPGFTTSAVLILGLGIGTSTAMVTVYRSVLVERLPVADQDRLVVMHPLDRGGAHLDVPFAYLEDLRHNSRTLGQVAGVYHLGSVPGPLLDHGDPVDIPTAYVTTNFFDVLGTRPALGRLLSPSDGAKGASHVMVISYTAWRRQFNADSLVVGRILTEPFDQSRITIVGVAPPGLEYPAGVESWRPVPLDFTAQVDIVARLTAGATNDAARSELVALTRRLNPFARIENNTFRPLIAGAESHVFTFEVLGNVRPVLVLLTVAVGLLLIIACVNVGTLLLVRASGRAREIAIRRAIGASYADLARQLLVENSVLGVAGGTAGLLWAEALLSLLLRVAPRQLPRTDVIRVAGAPLTAAIGITVLAVLVFGLLPSLGAARVDPSRSLRSDARSGVEARSRRRMRQWLVSSQVALALMLLTGGALLGRSLLHLQGQDLGYTPSHLSLLRLTGPQRLFSSPERDVAVADQLSARVRALPGVTGLTSVESPPFKGQSVFITKMAREDQSAAEAETAPYIPFEIADVDYFRTFQIPIVRGRGFLDTDTKAAPRVVVVSEALARRVWPDQDAVGKRLRNAYDTSRTLWTVVGVAHDTHFRMLRAAAPVIYTAWHQQDYPTWWGYFAVRTRDDLETILPSIRRAVHEFDPGLILLKAETMDQLLAEPLAQPRLSAVLLSAFAIVSMLLAGVGLYGVISSIVRQRTREIGIRVALGATPGRVRRLVFGDATLMLGVGSLVGFAGSIAGTRLLSSQLFGVTPTDPLSLVAACALLFGVGLSAALIPARWATRIDPARALRHE